MQPPAYPADESERLSALESIHLLDTEPEERFDRLTRIAKRLFNVPIALVSLIDANRQWFKSCQGLAIRETSREISFCGHTILQDGLFIIHDTLLDERFRDNPLVVGEPKIRFYAGMPLTVLNGRKLGTLCLIDHQPRQMSPEDQDLLRDLSRMAERELVAIQWATLDDLTLISNRRGFFALGCHTLALCDRLQKPAVLFVFDLNRFKQINDTYGHAAGDRALVDFASCLKQTFRNSDVLGRLGGDEFVVLLSQATPTDARTMLGRLDDALACHHAANPQDYQVTYSVGLAHFEPPQTPSLETLLLAADEAMYVQKQRGRATAPDVIDTV
jgi:diguanylate cyclase (GGDEF)-like protein